jgi:lactate permease
VPITTLSGVTGLSVNDLGSMVGRQTPVLALFVPLALVFIVDGKRGVRQMWPAAFVCGIVFAVFQYLSSNFWSVPLADIIASLVSAAAVLGFTRIWHPRETVTEGGAPVGADDDGELVPAGGPGTRRRRPLEADEGESAIALASSLRTDEGREVVDTRRSVFTAYAPYLVIIVVFVLATRIPAITGHAPTKVGTHGTGIESVTQIINWPGLHIFNAAGKAVATTFKLNYLSAAGTLLLISGLLSMIFLRTGPGRAARAYGRTLDQLKFAILTVMLVLGLGFIMNQAGQTTTLGLWAAGAGGAFAFLSPILGWLGVAVTGSDTSSNSLFGVLQVTAAQKTGLSPILMGAANSSGGVLGKMVSPQNLAIAAAAVGLEGREGDLFRRVIGWSLLFLLFMCVLVFLQSTAVLSWMVVGG